METFELVVHKKYTCWWEDCYQIEAETVEEAVKMITENKVDYYDCKELDDTLEWMYPEENRCLSEAQPTMEIFDPTDPRNKIGSIHSLLNNVQFFKTEEDEEDF